MYNLSLYGVTIIIWGSTWIITKYQVEESSALLAVMFRYILAAVILQLTVNLFRSKEYHSRKTHLLFFLLGSSLFCWNYVFFYNAAGIGLKTGLIAVIFSTIISMNILNNAIFFNDHLFHNSLKTCFSGRSERYCRLPSGDGGSNSASDRSITYLRTIFAISMKEEATHHMECVRI